MRLDGLPLEWVPPAGVGALMSVRAGGSSCGPYASLNLGERVGDDPAHVQMNRARFGRRIGVSPCWLHQVHGTRVVDAMQCLEGPPPEADASWADQPGVACTVQVADCLPVLLAARNGRAVAAAHAGWRGLAGGVVEQTLRAVCLAADCEAVDVLAWMGPCIGPHQFEVGIDVLEAFGLESREHFVQREHADGRARWLADLPGLARDRLQRAGIESISGGGWCTVEDGSRFFSFRRDRVTGRMAAAIWLEGR